LGVIGAGVYHARMAGSGTPALLGSGAPAGETLAGAIAVSQHLPAAQAAELLQTARDAFTSGLNVTGAVAAVLFCFVAVLTVSRVNRRLAVSER
jgi:DHA2 family multidrug resistance protein-like MFS transporter